VQVLRRELHASTTNQSQPCAAEDNALQLLSMHALTRFTTERAARHQQKVVDFEPEWLSPMSSAGAAQLQTFRALNPQQNKLYLSSRDVPKRQAVDDWRHCVQSFPRNLLRLCLRRLRYINAGIWHGFPALS
jgi:hypothetical protein